MRINEEYESELDILDALFHLLYRWRSILAAALLCAVLLGSFQFFKFKREAASVMAKYNSEMELYKESVKTYEEAVESYTVLLNERLSYRDESIFLNIDPENEWMALKRYLVICSSHSEAVIEQDPADSVLSMYAALIRADFQEEDMMSLFGTTQSDYINEVVTASIDYNSNLFTLIIKGSDEDSVRTILSYFDNLLVSECFPKAKESVNHKFISVSEEVYISSVDNSLVSKREELNKKIIEYQKAINDSQTALNAVAKPSMPQRNLKKYVVIGFLAGAFLMLAFYALRYIFSGKLHIPDDIAKQYSLPLYGNVAASRAKRPGKFPDNLIERLEFRNANTDENLEYDNICALIESNCPGRKVLLTGTLSKAAMLKTSEKIRARLGDDYIVDVEPKFLSNNKSIKSAEEAGFVLIVEKKHETSLASLERMAEIITIGGIKVDGAILI